MVTPGDSKKLHFQDHVSLGFKRGLLWSNIRHVVIVEKAGLIFQVKNAFQKTPSINIERVSSSLVRSRSFGGLENLNLVARLTSPDSSIGV